MEIDLSKKVTIDEFQRATAVFTNGLPKEYQGKVSMQDFSRLKNKIMVEYGGLLKKNQNLQGQADKDFFDKLNNTQIRLAELQKDRLETKYEMFKEDIKKVKHLEEENRRIIDNLEKIKGETDLDKAARDALKQDIALRNQSIQQIIYQVIGVNEYQEVSRYDEQVAQINKQITDLNKTKGNTKALTDEIFDKNTAGIGHLGIKALRHQLDLKMKADNSEAKMKEFNSKIEEVRNKFNKETNPEKRADLNEELQKLKYDKRLVVGLKDYTDKDDPNKLDIINKPLYIAPENMLPGYGSLSSLEEYKATIRMAQEDFAKRILSDEAEYKILRQDYEKETGKKVTSHEEAIKLAKKHIGGTFDNAHAGAWLKHFKRENGESEEHRIDRFNKWLNGQAEEMYKEGIIKHVHFNDTQGKDDDHNLLGSGVLDIHDLRTRLRKAGFDEALIVEAGGRGADSNMHLLNAFEIFNPMITQQPYSIRTGESESSVGNGASSVSDWVTVKRDYNQRPQYSQYGMGYTAFRHVPPQQGQPKGDWSGTGFM